MIAGFGEPNPVELLVPGLFEKDQHFGRTVLESDNWGVV